MCTHRRRPAAHICQAALLGPRATRASSKQQRSRFSKHSLVVAAAAAGAAAASSPDGSGGGSSASAAAAQQQPQKGGISRLLSWLPDRQAVQLVSDAWTLLYSNLWAVVALFLAKDAAAFVLHRLVHRLTNYSECVGVGSRWGLRLVSSSQRSCSVPCTSS